MAAAAATAESLRAGQLIILESTTYPGTTEEVLIPLLESSGLVAGQDMNVAFSPKRIYPGNTLFGVTNTPKVVGASPPTAPTVRWVLIRLSSRWPSGQSGSRNPR